MEGEGPPTETSPSAFLLVLEGKLGWWPRPGCSAQAGAGSLARTPTSPGQARPGQRCHTARDANSVYWESWSPV